jgi:hypothetical protein
MTQRGSNGEAPMTQRGSSKKKEENVKVLGALNKELFPRISIPE